MQQWERGSEGEGQAGEQALRVQVYIPSIEGDRCCASCPANLIRHGFHISL